jgi:hypothetical protein
MNAQGGRIVPVEGYDVEHELPKSPLCKEDVVVRAWCSHGTGQKHYRMARIEVPFWWSGEQHLLSAIASLLFFVPGERTAEHGLVTRIN